ncbi:MAG: isoprenylcysteine carboxylmethyltransferase family protein [Bacteroidota bacterium]|nr:isoprenylcysteine carboxylmethyltransferase family protein [Bacteroidota bacterium]
MSASAWFFKYRSYTPLPFLLIMLVFARPTVLSLIIGFVIALSGELLRSWGVFHVGSETRVTDSVGASRLVTSGPFAYTRNPLYIGNMLIYIGIGIMSFALFPWLQIFALAYFIVQYSFIVRDEERFLFERFGEEYAQYRRNVPRFLFRCRPYSGPMRSRGDWRAWWDSEARTLQAFVLVTGILTAIWLFR